MEHFWTVTFVVKDAVSFWGHCPQIRDLNKKIFTKYSNGYWRMGVQEEVQLTNVWQGELRWTFRYKRHATGEVGGWIEANLLSILTNEISDLKWKRLMRYFSLPLTFMYLTISLKPAGTLWLKEMIYVFSRRVQSNLLSSQVTRYSWCVEVALCKCRILAESADSA